MAAWPRKFKVQSAAIVNIDKYWQRVAKLWQNEAIMVQPMERMK
jgi:hypothetical protein